MMFSLARTGAALATRFDDLYVQHRRLWVRLRQKARQASRDAVSPHDRPRFEENQSLACVARMLTAGRWTAGCQIPTPGLMTPSVPDTIIQSVPLLYRLPSINCV